MKKIFKNIVYWIEINCYLAIFHFFTLIGLAFNDTGEHYNNVVESLLYLRNGLSLIILISIMMGFLFRKKENFNILQYIIFQTSLIILWGLYYINNLVG